MSGLLAVGSIDFARDELLAEFDTAIDPRLRGVLLALGYESNRRHWPRPVVTSLMRTEDEQRRLNPRLPDGPHTDGRGADLRVTIYTTDCAVAVVAWLNAAFGDAPQRTAIRHDVGAGDHIHVQVPRREVVGATRVSEAMFVTS